MMNIRLLQLSFWNELDIYGEEVEAGEIQLANPQITCIQKNKTQKSNFP